MMGIAFDIQHGAPNILANPKGKEWADGFAQGGEAAGKAAFDLITNFSQGPFPRNSLLNTLPALQSSTRSGTISLKPQIPYNEPGRFTALIGFEWTSVPKGYNLHRNVVLRDDGSRARQVLPLTTQPPLGTTDPLDLYQWLGRLRGENRWSGSCNIP